MRISTRHTLKDAHEEGAWACCWVPGTRSVLTGAVDETVKLWTSSDDGLSIEKTYHGQAGHTLGVVSVSVDPTGEWAASSALDSYVRVWSLKDQNQERALLESMPTEVWSVAFSPTSDKCIIAAAGGTTGKVKVWDITAMTPGIKSPPLDPELFAVSSGKSAEQQFVLSLAYSPDGESLACGCMDGTVCIFDVRTKQLKAELVGHFKPVRSLAFTPDSKQVVTACDDMQVHLYEASGNLIEGFSGHESWVLGLAVHPDGNHFVSSSSDGSVKLWDIPQRSCVATAREHSDQVWAVALCDDGSEAASCGDDGKLVTYSLQ